MMKHLPRRYHVLLITVTIAGCSGDGPNKNPDGGTIPEIGLPDGFELHPCTTPGETCNAHNACAIDPICGNNNKCYPSRFQECGDGLECTVDICKGQGLCGYEPLPGMCALPVKLEGDPPKTVIQCFRTGDRNPDDQCMVCNPVTADGGSTAPGDPLHWSPANGGSCDDGNPCTKNDYCQNGTCRGDDFSAKCADGYSCTEDLCDGQGNCLGSKLRDDSCLINGECHKDQQQDEMGCNICDVKTSQNKWTPLSVYCKIGATCYKPATKDPTGCGVCDPTADDKGWTPVPDKCLIGPTCYNEGAKDLTQCLTCTYAANPTGWSTVVGVSSTAFAFEDGQSPPAGWTITNSDAKVGWVVSTNRPGAGTYSLYYGDPAVKKYFTGAINSGTATMPAIALTAGKKAGLSFLLYMDTRTGTTYDKLNVLVGTTSIWTKSYTTVPKMKAWQEVTIDLSAYAGQSIQIIFEFNTVNATSTSGEGVFLDNVLVYHNC